MKQQALIACQGALSNSKEKVNTLLLQLCRGFEVQMEEVIQRPGYPEAKLHTIVKGYQKFMAYLTAQLTDSDLFDASTDEHIQKFLNSLPTEVTSAAQDVSAGSTPAPPQATAANTTAATPPAAAAPAAGTAGASMSEPQLPPHLRSRVTATTQATGLPAASALSDQQQQQRPAAPAPAVAPAAAADMVQGISALPADALAQLARSMQPVVRDGKVIGFNMPSHLLSAAAAPAQAGAQAAASAAGSAPAAQPPAQAAGQAAAGAATAPGYLTAAASVASPGHPVAATHQQQKPSRLEENPMVQTLLAAIGAAPLQATASVAAAGSAAGAAGAGAGGLPHAWSSTDANLQAQHSLPAMASTNLAGPAAPAPVAVSGYGGPISGYSAAQQPSSAVAPPGSLPQHMASASSVLAWQPLAAPAAAAANQPAARWNAVISPHSSAAHAAPPPAAAAAPSSARGHEPMVKLGASTQAQPQHEPMTRIPVSSIRPGAGPYQEPHHTAGASSTRKRERSPGRADSPGRPHHQQHVAEPAGPGGTEARQDPPAAGQQAGAARDPRLGLQAHTCTQYKQLPAELAELVEHMLVHHAGLLRPEAFGEPSVRRALEAVHQANAHSAVSILQQLLRYDRARLLGIRDLRGYIVAACKRSMEEMGRGL